MEPWIDDLARQLARGASRREALGWLGRRLGGLALLTRAPDSGDRDGLWQPRRPCPAGYDRCGGGCCDRRTHVCCGDQCCPLGQCQRPRVEPGGRRVPARCEAPPGDVFGVETEEPPEGEIPPDEAPPEESPPGEPIAEEPPPEEGAAEPDGPFDPGGPLPELVGEPWPDGAEDCPPEDGPASFSPGVRAMRQAPPCDKAPLQGVVTEWNEGGPTVMEVPNPDQGRPPFICVVNRDAIPDEPGVDWKKWLAQVIGTTARAVHAPLQQQFAGDPRSYEVWIDVTFYPDGAWRSHPQPIGPELDAQTRHYMLSAHRYFAPLRAPGSYPRFPTGSQLKSVTRHFVFRHNVGNAGVVIDAAPEEPR